MKNNPSWSDKAGGEARPEPPSVSAVVLTHRRPRLATEVVRSLVEREGLLPNVLSCWSTRPEGWTTRP